MGEQVDALSPAGVSELATFIIRPPRAQYSRADLGDKSFTIDGTPAVRHDTVITNDRGLRLQASHFRAVRTGLEAPTVVYLHGNGSCRVEATMLLSVTIPYGLSLFAFDFSGSGRSEGDYISLGVWERHDVTAVVNHLVSLGVRSIVLWGHSMGAATALMFAGLCERRHEVKALILDSPYASFEKLAHSMVSDMQIPMGVPKKLILTVGVRAVRKIVRERAGFDVCDIDPLAAVRKIDDPMPVLFLHGSSDAVVPISHGELLHKYYPGNDKQWIMLKDYEHDSPRPEWSMDKAHVFLQRTIGEDGVGSVSHLELLKGRGNIAMLAGRFPDSIFLYTEALNALSESLLNLSFADAVGEIYDTDERESVARKTSSITNFVSSMKRWRTRASDEASQSRPRRAASEHGKNHDIPDDTSQAASNPEYARSESSTWSGRFTRTRSWRGRGIMESFRKCMRVDRGDILGDPDFGDFEGPEPGASMPRRSSRSSRSATKVRLRHRAKRETNRFPSEDHKDKRSLRTFRRETRSRYRSEIKIFRRRTRTEDTALGHNPYMMAGMGISAWDMDQERKHLALALLCNRSLARRRTGDVRGALFDAATSLQLDPGWVRGYLRKAAALREDGQLELARGVVADGLAREPQHAGLMDLMRSIEEAVEAEKAAQIPRLTHHQQDSVQSSA